LKYEPPTIAFEYNVKSFNINYLLQINLEEMFNNNKTPEEISSWIIQTYSDILNKSTISRKQVILSNLDN
jgi:hypothetical protein